jgi:hypothetical protein
MMRIGRLRYSMSERSQWITMADRGPESNVAVGDATVSWARGPRTDRL